MEFPRAFVHDGGEYSVSSFVSDPVSMDLLWFLLEAGVALLLLLGIVWWTWPRSQKPPGDGER